MKRRDFLQGTALSLAFGAGLSPGEILARSGLPRAPYPPALTGLRGSHPGSFDAAHDLAWNGRTWPRPKTQTDQTYDLVVVGAGISGLAAAHFYRQRIGEDARILVLDNHDDFGGHARRNEFTVGGKTLLCYGGSQSLDSPNAYSLAARGLLKDLGVDTDRFYSFFDAKFEGREHLTDGILFRAQDSGADLLTPHALSWFEDIPRQERIARIKRYPVSDETRAALIRLADGEMRDTMEVRRILAAPRKVSTDALLRSGFSMTDEGLALLNRRTGPLWGVGTDALSVREVILEYTLGPAAARATYPFLEDALEPRDESEPYIFHFPDGNASIARLLVRALVPSSMAGSTMEDIVTARADYGALDDASNPVRIRLNSTAVTMDNRAGGVDLTYVHQGDAYRVRARHAIFAGYNAMLPHLCREMDNTQREALEYPEKIPLALITVALDNWRAIKASGMSSYYAPSGVLTNIGMDFPVSMGDYAFTQSPDEPCVLQGWQTPACGQPGDAREQLRAGRMDIYLTSFDDYEQAIKDELDAAWGSHGLDVERDIKGITVNRWPHGYAYEYLDLWDDHDWGRGAGPHVIARQQIGNIAIANSDSEQYAYVNAAIDAANRAVRELTTG